MDLIVFIREIAIFDKLISNSVLSDMLMKSQDFKRYVV